jgi:hypothetical protein
MPRMDLQVVSRRLPMFFRRERLLETSFGLFLVDEESVDVLDRHPGLRQPQSAVCDIVREDFARLLEVAVDPDAAPSCCQKQARIVLASPCWQPRGAAGARSIELGDQIYPATRS